MGSLILTNIATIPSGITGGDSFLFFHTVDKMPYFIDDAGLIARLSPFYFASVADSAAINTTETIIGGGSVALADKVPANILRVGSVIRTTILGTNTSTAAIAATLRIRFGTLGTLADTAIATAAVTSAAAGTNIPFKIQITFTVRTIGAAGTISGSMEVITTGITGIASVATTVVQLTVAALNTTVDNYITVTHQTAATTTTNTFKNVLIEIIQ